MRSDLAAVKSILSLVGPVRDIESKGHGARSACDAHWPQGGRHGFSGMQEYTCGLADALAPELCTGKGEQRFRVPPVPECRQRDVERCSLIGEI